MHNRRSLEYIYQPTAPAQKYNNQLLISCRPIAHLVQTSVLNNLVIELFPPLHSHSSSTTTATAWGIRSYKTQPTNAHYHFIQGYIIIVETIISYV